jgi:UDP-2-acetamido-2-deoxy-ribo-hexuluronate aminotransferase
MLVPFIDLKRFEDGFLLKWLEKVATMSQRAQFIGGDEVLLLERRLAEIAQTTNTVTCANGTDAIQLALRALDIGRGDLVLVPNMTFWATFEAVVNVGGVPITVDVDIADGGVDLNAYEEAIRRYRPKAAVIAHLYGWGSNSVQKIRKISSEEGVLLIEDGAQCFGTLYQGASLFKGATIATTSFYPAKVLGAAGDGGAVFTNDVALAEKVRQLGNHGRTSHYGYGAVGWNSRLDSLQAAYLNLALDYLNQRIASRQASSNIYARDLSELGIKQLFAPSQYSENGYANVCLIDNQQTKVRLEKILKTANIGYGNIYPGALSDQPGAALYLRAHVGANNAQKLSREVLNLPLFPYMTTKELEYVIQTVMVGISGA